MTFALDTNTMSYYMRQEGGVVAHFQAQPPQQIALPSMVVYELNYGLRRVGRRSALDALARLVQTVAVLDFDLEALGPAVEHVGRAAGLVHAPLQRRLLLRDGGSGENEEEQGEAEQRRNPRRR